MTSSVAILCFFYSEKTTTAKVLLKTRMTPEEIKLWMNVVEAKSFNNIFNIISEVLGNVEKSAWRELVKWLSELQASCYY